MAYRLFIPKIMLGIALISILPEVNTEEKTSDSINNENVPHSRQKRILWITNDGRLALPPGTTMVITPSVSMPFVRYPPDGFLSNMTVSLPFTIDFDKLGLTDNENPYGTLPPIFARSLGRAAGSAMADYVGQFLDQRRGKRSAGPNLPEDVEQYIAASMHGGERALLYILVEELMMNFGMAGKPCLLRAICEIHVHPLKRYGFLGEVLRLFLTPTKSEHANLLGEYVEAENLGKNDGECFPYFKECPKSLFISASSKYLKKSDDSVDEAENEVEQRNLVDLKLM